MSKFINYVWNYTYCKNQITTLKIYKFNEIYKYFNPILYKCMSMLRVCPWISRILWILDHPLLKDDLRLRLNLFTEKTSSLYGDLCKILWVIYKTKKTCIMCLYCSIFVSQTWVVKDSGMIESTGLYLSSFIDEINPRLSLYQGLLLTKFFNGKVGFFTRERVLIISTKTYYLCFVT